MTPRDSAAIELRFSGGQPLADVLRAALAEGERLQLAGAAAARFNIVLEELLANLFEHGGLGAEGRVELSIARRGEQVELQLFDTGAPFDPRRATRAMAIPERGGGAGLDIVSRWTEFLSYTPGPPLNSLVLRLRNSD